MVVKLVKYLIHTIRIYYTISKLLNVLEHPKKLAQLSMQFNLNWQEKISH